MPAVILYFTEQRPRQKPENAHFRAKETDKKRRATPKFLSATRGDRKTIAGTVRCKHPAGTAMANLICLLSPSKRSTKKKGAGEKNKIQRRTKTCQEREKNPNRCQASETQNRTFRIAGEGCRQIDES